MKLNWRERHGLLHNLLRRPVEDFSTSSVRSSTKSVRIYYTVMHPKFGKVSVVYQANDLGNAWLEIHDEKVCGAGDLRDQIEGVRNRYPAFALQEAVSLPMSRWTGEKSHSGTWSFRAAHRFYGSFSIQTWDRFGESARLDITGFDGWVSGAGWLYRRLSGQWSLQMKCRLHRKMIAQDGEGWQYHPADEQHPEARLTLVIDGDKITVTESGLVTVQVPVVKVSALVSGDKEEIELSERQVMRRPELYRTLDRQVALDDFEHRDL